MARRGMQIVYGRENPNGTRGSLAPGTPDALCMTPGPNPVLFIGDLYPSRIYKVSLGAPLASTGKRSSATPRPGSGL